MPLVVQSRRHALKQHACVGPQTLVGSIDDLLKHAVPRHSVVPVLVAFGELFLLLECSEDIVHRCSLPFNRANNAVRQTDGLAGVSSFKRLFGLR